MTLVFAEKHQNILKHIFGPVRRAADLIEPRNADMLLPQMALALRDVSAHHFQFSFTSDHAALYNRNKSIARFI